MRRNQRDQDGMETTEENEDGTGAEAEAETEVEAPTDDVTETIGDAVLIVPRDETKGIAAGIAIVIADTAETAIEVEAEIGEATDVMMGEMRGETRDVTRSDREIGAGSVIVRDQGSTDDGAQGQILVEKISTAIVL